MRHAIFKILLDPTDFLEYFCSTEDFQGFIKDLYGFNELQLILNRFSLNPIYSKEISQKHSIPYRPSTEVPQKDLEAFFRLPLQDPEGLAYLNQRGFSEDWVKEYQVLSFKPSQLFEQDLGSISKYWLFDEGEVDHREYLLKRFEFEYSLREAPFLAIPSRDREGKINNIAFRSVDPILAEQVKWMFSHGREATFGLDKVDPSQKTYIVEGFFDHIALSKSGYQAVALGSAFPSQRHLQLLEGLEVVFCMDQDATGEKYMEKLSNLGYPIARMKQQAKDPWEALNKYGSIELEA